MSELKIFENSEFGSVRTLEVNGKPYFCGSDIAKSLGYSNVRDAISRHCKGVVKHDIGVQTGIKTDGTPAMQNVEMLFIPEGDIYRLIVRSKLPSADRFESWVFDEVLPAIRKHGMYAVDELIDNPDIAIKAFTALKEERDKSRALAERNKALEAETMEMGKKILELQPKADYVDVILRNKGTVTTTQIAQDYGMSAKKFNKMLYVKGIQRKVNNQWILYAKYQGNGYVQSKSVNITRSSGEKDVVMNTEWTQKGRMFLYTTLKADSILPTIEMNV